ncbi:hypothetical protein Csa_019881 [Cucumis sativus]|uniref:Uncharacterized protein n=1 Tax=Cucumis sativus TaxID=3659 RepID=A0A0A0M0F2_CUCSA|nr:hypothetical protein Csa_019881 [Cucumis sativus]
MKSMVIGTWAECARRKIEHYYEVCRGKYEVASNRNGPCSVNIVDCQNGYPYCRLFIFVDDQDFDVSHCFRRQPTSSRVSTVFASDPQPLPFLSTTHNHEEAL